MNECRWPESLYVTWILLKTITLIADERLKEYEQK